MLVLAVVPVMLGVLSAAKSPQSSTPNPVVTRTSTAAPVVYGNDVIAALTSLGFTCPFRLAPIGQITQCHNGKQRGTPPAWDELVNITDGNDDTLDAVDGYVSKKTAAALKKLKLGLEFTPDGSTGDVWVNR